MLLHNIIRVHFELPNVLRYPFPFYFLIPLILYRLTYPLEDLKGFCICANLRRMTSRAIYCTQGVDAFLWA